MGGMVSSFVFSIISLYFFFDDFTSKFNFIYIYLKLQSKYFSKYFIPVLLSGKLINTDGLQGILSETIIKFDRKVIIFLIIDYIF